jgi:hypothetical protein
MPRLLVLGCSARKHRAPGPVPAWYRYDGVLYRVCKRLQADGRFPDDVRVRIISAEHGVLTPDAAIAWYERRLDASRAAELREGVTEALRRAVVEERVSEVYLALGAAYRAAVGPLPAGLPVRGEPAGIGTMHSRLRRWLASPRQGDGQLHLPLGTPDPCSRDVPTDRAFPG